MTKKVFSAISFLKTWLSEKDFDACACVCSSATLLVPSIPSYSSAHSLLFGTPWIASRVTLLTLVHLARATLRHLGKSIPFFLRCQCPIYFRYRPLFVVPFDYRHETHRLSPETPAHVFLFLSLNVCGTRLWTVSLANNRSRRFLRSHPTSFTISSPHLILRDIPGHTCRSIHTYIPIYICIKLPSVTADSVVWKSRRARHWKSREASRSLAGFRKFIRGRSVRSIFFSRFLIFPSPSPSKIVKLTKRPGAAASEVSTVTFYTATVDNIFYTGTFEGLYRPVNVYAAIKRVVSHLSLEGLSCEVLSLTRITHAIRARRPLTILLSCKLPGLRHEAPHSEFYDGNVS